MMKQQGFLFSVSLTLPIVLSWAILTATAAASQANQKNVLLMFIDDGGFQMGVYGNKAVKTPNIDNFAKKAVLFKHGFTSVSSCSPSRSALLTGELQLMLHACHDSVLVYM